MAPRKRNPELLGTLLEPDLPAEGWEHLRRGAFLFNDGAYWHAHEEWESAWLLMPEGPGGDAEIILRGLIQLAAALHLEGIGRESGATGNFRKAEAKLALAPARFMGTDIDPLRSFIGQRLRGEPGDRPPRIVFSQRRGEI